MLRYWKRLAVALTVSSSFFLGTVIWYRSGLNPKAHRADKNPIARLSESTNEVQRKPLARVIWENITQNEDLYSGEAIRTSTASEAKILFLKTGDMIELEPDSLIVLEENEDGLALNFLQGHLFVKSGSESGESLKLKSGNSEIALNNADINLSRTSQGQLDLDVIDGSAQFKNGNKQVTLEKNQSGTLGTEGLDIAKNRIQVTSPLPGEPVYVGDTAAVSFQWQKLPEGYEVSLESGDDRTALQAQDVKAGGEVGELSSALKIGKNYWRLIAKHSDPNKPELRSPIFPLDVLAKSPPLVLEPESNAQLAVDSSQPEIKLRWVQRSNYETLVVEVAKDRQLREKVIQQTLDSKLNFANLSIKQGGTYYLRLTGFMKIKEKLEPVSSPIQKFDVQVGIKVVPPQLLSPLPQQTISYQQAIKNGVQLSWSPVLGIEKYKIEVEKESNPPGGPALTVLDQTVVTPPYRMGQIEPGVYKWLIRSIGPDGQPSLASESRIFKVESMPLIEWVDGPEPSEFLYYTHRPSFIAQWKRGEEAAVSWRVRYALAENFTPDLTWQNVSEPLIKTYVDSPGVYQIEVEGLSAEGKPVAKSTVKAIKIKEKPLLPAPEFAQNLPETLTADRKGRLSVQWLPVEGATKYKIELIDSKTESVVSERYIERTIASMNQLTPGQYKVKVKAVDQHNRDGQPSGDKLLEVPKVSDIQAPKIKSFKVE